MTDPSSVLLEGIPVIAAAKRIGRHRDEIEMVGSDSSAVQAGPVERFGTFDA